MHALEEGYHRMRRELGLKDEYQCCSYWLAKNPDDVKNCRLKGTRSKCGKLTTNPDVKEFGSAGDAACDSSTPEC